jgi:hypothetical protein
MAETFLKRLQRFFQVGMGKTGRGRNTVVPLDVTVNKNNIPKTRNLKMTSDIQRLWDWYVEQNSDSSKTLKDRMDRYNDLEYMVYNDTVISMAVELYADEASQADMQSEPIMVEASPKIRTAIQGLLETWGVNQTYVREVAYNLALYGDSFDANVYSPESGIESVVPLDVRSVTERIEFKAAEVAKIHNNSGMRQYLSSHNRIDSLVNDLSNTKSEVGKYFNSFLIAYSVDGILNYLPPWAVNHYRFFSRRSEFWPYGRSLFINLVGPFRQLKTSKNLMAISRAMKFPKEVYEVETSEQMTAIEKWDAVNEARQEFQNLGNSNQSKDSFSAGSEIWIPAGLLNYNTYENNLRLEDIADIELLRDDLIMGTRIPKGYLVVDQASFGTSGQSLLQQHKPFGRAVYSIQSVILQELTRLIKIHFLMTEQFEKEHTKFDLLMNFPVMEEADDRLRMKGDTLGLANDILSNLGNAMGLDREGFPPEIVKMIFSKYSFLDSDVVEEIIKGMEAFKNANAATDGADGSSQMWASRTRLVNRLQESEEDGLFYEALSESRRKRGITEGAVGGKHFRTSSQYVSEHDIQFAMLRQDREKLDG